MSKKQTAKSSWIHAVAYVAVAGISALLAYGLADMNKSFRIELDKDGKIAVAVSADETFAKLLEKALTAGGPEVDAVLAGKKYYSLTNVKLVDELENLDFSDAKAAEIAKRLRRMLWDLRGPFKLPGTLRGADQRMTGALEDLDKAVEDSKRSSALLAELWKRMLDQEGIFRVRFFKATVTLVRHAPNGGGKTAIVYVCPGSALATGRIMQLYTDRGGNIFAEVRQNNAVLDCDGSTPTAESLLAEGSITRLGLGEEAFKQLVASEGATVAANGTVDAKFAIYPKNQIALSSE
ncbi:MAG TPA: hypothetical protein VIF14_04035 [Alphaproteobacteria bacterium]|jgi:hypothetical protein